MIRADTKDRLQRVIERHAPHAIFNAPMRARFGRHAVGSCRHVFGGLQCVVRFPNGYGASVIRHSGSYGGAEGRWELAVIGPDGSLAYDTPITSDVKGWLTPADVEGLLDRIAAL